MLCTASLILPYAHAQHGDADTQQLTLLHAKAAKGDAHAQSELGKAFWLGRKGSNRRLVSGMSA
jgi:hypothetical protein